MAEPGKRTTYETLGEALTARGCSSVDREIVSRVVERLAERAGSPRRFYVGEKDNVVGVFFGGDATVGLYAYPSHVDVTSDALNNAGGIAGMAELYPGFGPVPGDRAGKAARLQLAGQRGGQRSAPRSGSRSGSTGGHRSAPSRASASPSIRKAVCCDLSQSVGHRCFVCDEIVTAD